MGYFEHAAQWNPSLDGLDYNWGRAAFAASRFGDAIGPVSRYLKTHPDDIGARSVLAISQFMVGSYQECRDTLQPVAGRNILTPQAEYVYAASLVKTGQIESGMERLEHLEATNPEIPDVHRVLGEALVLRGEKQHALEEFRTAVQLSPQDADTHYDFGKAELENGDATAAIPELEKAAQLAPQSETFHHTLADAYKAVSRTADAQKQMEICDVLKSRAQTMPPHQAPAQ